MHTIDFQMQTQRLGKALKGVLWWCRDSFIFTASATIQGFVFIWINSFLFWACFFRPKINLRILRDINYRFTKITKLQTTVDNLDKYNLVLENDSLNYHEMFPGWLWWWCWFFTNNPLSLQVCSRDLYSLLGSVISYHPPCLPWPIRPSNNHICQRI